MKSKVEKYRILLSRAAVAVGLFFLCSTKSCWETKNDKIAFCLFFVGIALVGIASMGRMWCSIYIAGYKNKMLITNGPYSLCRNPLYFFSMIGVIGIGCATETFTFPIVFAILFSTYYPFVIKGEERRLVNLFGALYENYANKVPAFFPSFLNFEEPDHYSINPAVYRRHIFSAIWFVWIVGILEVIEGFREIGVIGYLWSVY